jgi:uncharacterized membrane protein YbhN (UPF0104 family)
MTSDILPDAKRTAPQRFNISLPNLVIGVTSVGVLATLVVAQHHQIARSLSEVARAKPRALLGAVGLEWVSMLAFVRVQRRLLRAGNLRLTIESIIAITSLGTPCRSRCRSPVPD